MSGGSNHEATLAALEPKWRARPLTLQPFLPEDNRPDPLAAGHGLAWLAHASHELGWLLRLKFPRFASHCLHDPGLRVLLDSYLRHRDRPFDTAATAQVGAPAALAAPGGPTPAATDDPPAATDASSPAYAGDVLALLDRRAFLVLLRLVSGEHRPLLLGPAWSSTHGEAGGVPGGGCGSGNGGARDAAVQGADGAWGAALCYAGGGVLSLPKLMDACAVAGPGNPKLCASLVASALRLDPGGSGNGGGCGGEGGEGGLVGQLRASGRALVTVLEALDDRAGGSGNGGDNGGGNDDGGVAVLDALRYAGDIGGCVAGLIEACPGPVLAALARLPPLLDARPTSASSKHSYSLKHAQASSVLPSILPREVIRAVARCYETTVPRLEASAAAGAATARAAADAAEARVAKAATTAAETVAETAGAAAEKAAQATVGAVGAAGTAAGQATAAEAEAEAAQAAADAADAAEAAAEAAEAVATGCAEAGLACRAQLLRLLDGALREWARRAAAFGGGGDGGGGGAVGDDDTNEGPRGGACGGGSGVSWCDEVMAVLVEDASVAPGAASGVGCRSLAAGSMLADYDRFFGLVTGLGGGGGVCGGGRGGGGGDGGGSVAHPLLQALAAGGVAISRLRHFADGVAGAQPSRLATSRPGAAAAASAPGAALPPPPTRPSSSLTSSSSLSPSSGLVVGKGGVSEGDMAKLVDAVLAVVPGLGEVRLRTVGNREEPPGTDENAWKIHHKTRRVLWRRPLKSTHILSSTLLDLPFSLLRSLLFVVLKLFVPTPP